MAVIVCPRCGEMCHDYDSFCPRCGAYCRGKEDEGCDGNCFGCEYDMPHGCTKPMREIPFVSPYPHSIVQKKGKLLMIEDTDKRNRIGMVLLSLLPTSALGIHDFYGRFHLRGIGHLGMIAAGIVLKSVGVNIGSLGFFLSWILGIIEGVLVLSRVIKTDGKGFPFA